jgi:TP901 family phage tail tape measure protein
VARERLQVILEMVTGQFKSEARGVSGSLNRMRGDFAQTGKASGMLEQGFSKIGRTAQLAIAGAAVGAFAAFTREMVMSVRAFADFEKSLNQSLAIMGDVPAALRNEMSAAAREVGRTTTFSAKEAAEAYFFLASAGFDAQQSIAAMPQVAKFAQAGMFDMALATDLATDAQSALGLSSDNAAQNLANLTRVTDVFVRANTLANTSVQQIAEAFTNKVGAALRALNKDVEEGAAVLAAFADQGVKGAEAGTQFSIVLRDLQTKALANKAAFLEAGVAVFDAAGNMRNMADIIGDIEGALAGMSDAEKKSTLLNLGFADKSVSAITTLLGTSDAIREYERALRSSAGFTEDVAARQLETLSGQWELVRSKVEDTRIEVGERMAPALRDLIPHIEGVVDSMGEFAVAAAPSVAGGLEFMIKMVEGAQEAFFDLKAAILGVPGTIPLPFGLGNIGDLIGSNQSAILARQQGALMETLAMIRRQGLTSADRHAPTEFANALVHLERQALLTQDSMEALARTFGLNTEETLMGLAAYEQWMKVHKEDIPLDDLERWVLEVEAAAMAAQELERYRSMFPELFGEAGSAAGSAADGVGEFGDEIVKTADEAERLAEALQLAADAQQSLADQLLRFVNPVFNALSAVDGLRSAQEKLDSAQQDSETSAIDLAQAELEVTRKTVEAQAAIDALGEGSDAIDAMALAFEGPRSRLLEILDLLGLYRDGDWSNFLDLELRVSGLERVDRILQSEGFKYNPPNEDTRAPATPTGWDSLSTIAGAQHQGGFVEAGSRQHVLANEVFVPAQSGFVFPEMPTIQAGDQNITIVVPDAPQAAHVESLLRQNHSLTRGGLRGGAR